MNIIFSVIWEGTGPSAPAVVASLLGRTGSLIVDNQAVIEAEREIDTAFEASPLLALAYNQAVWTLLAVNEDIFLRDHTERPHEEMHAVIDTRINALTHPLRACLKHCQPGKTVVRRAYIAEDYGHAIQWLRDAVHYDQFCTIFPLWHRQRLMLTVEGNRLVVEDSDKDDKTYEAYNRIVRKEGRPAPRLRQYLPKTGQGFTVVPFPIKTGEWSAEWYGITAPARPTSVLSLTFESQPVANMIHSGHGK